MNQSSSQSSNMFFPPPFLMAESVKDSLPATPKHLLRCMMREGWTWRVSHSDVKICIERDGFRHHIESAVTWNDLFECYKAYGAHLRSMVL